MKLNPSAHFLIYFATSIAVAFLLCAFLASCQSPEPPDSIDVLIEGRMQSLVGTMFDTEGRPR